MDLFSVLGQDIPKKFLTSVIKSKDISHFYLFVGPPGVGKGKMAEEFAIFLICEGTDGLCSKKVRDNVHPDVKIVDEKVIKISHVKEIQKEVNLSPIESRRKVVVIKDVEGLTQEGANAFLKTLEEPPEDTIFVLTSSYMHMLPKTILSRAQLVRFSLLSRDTVESIWRDVLKREDPLPVYDGTLHFVDTLDMRTLLFTLFSVISRDRERKRVYDLFEQGIRKRNILKESRRDIVNIWFSFLKDVFLSENDGIINLYKKGEIEKIKESFTSVKLPFIFEPLSYLEKGIIFNINFNIWWEYLILSTYDILFGG